MPKTKEDELDLLDQEDFVDDDEIDDEIDDDKGSEEQTEDKDWFMPGRFKTKKDAEKGMRKSEQYRKQLEQKVRALEKKVDKLPDQDQQQVQVGSGSGDQVDQAIEELGIKDDDFITAPVETNKKIMRYIAQKMIPASQQEVMAQAGSIKADIVKKEIKQMYPNFDLDGQEDKVANILRQRFNADYVRKYPLKAISTVIEELGAKKVKRGSAGSGTPYTEDPTNETTSSKKATTLADKIRSGINKADVGSPDLFN